MHNQVIVEAETINPKIGKRLRAARKARGLSQSNVADTLGVTFQQIGRYESGENGLSTAVFLVLCRALRVKPSELLGDMFA